MSDLDQRTGSDCLRCCVAFALGLAYDEVPDFVGDHGDRWSAELSAWASQRGWTMLRFQTKRTPLTAMVPDGQTLWIADGPGPRGSDHAVVFRGEEMVHDPHPSRAGLSHAHGVTILVRDGVAATASDPEPSRTVTSARAFADKHGTAAAVTAAIVAGPPVIAAMVTMCAIAVAMIVAMIPGAVLPMVASAAERGIRRALGLRAIGHREDA